MSQLRIDALNDKIKSLQAEIAASTATVARLRKEQRGRYAGLSKEVSAEVDAIISRYKDQPLRSSTSDEINKAVIRHLVEEHSTLGIQVICNFTTDKDNGITEIDYSLSGIPVRDGTLKKRLESAGKSKETVRVIIDDEGVLHYAPFTGTLSTTRHTATAVGQGMTPCASPLSESAVPLTDLRATKAKSSTEKFGKKKKRKWLPKWLSFAKLKKLKKERDKRVLYRDYKRWLNKHAYLWCKLAGISHPLPMAEMTAWQKCMKVATLGFYTPREQETNE